MPTLEDIHGKENCHICGKPRAGAGSEYCSYPHGMVPDEPVDGADGMWTWKLPQQPADLLKE